MTLEHEIKTEAARLGFNLCGITLPETPLHFPVYLHWLEDGCHADMSYMARPDAILKREDPHLLLLETRAVICVGLAYPLPASLPKPKSERPLGRISAYAWGADYHAIILSKLERLAETIERMTGKMLSYKTCVDTSPILEKDFARQAGLGWIGRNGLLVAPQVGSFVFLGELLVDLDLNPDQPNEDNPCAECIRCSMACPTKAIRADRAIDARRCLSYLTIEHRGSIPVSLRQVMGDRIFGCDACQAVCPSNRESQPGAYEPALHPQIDPYPDLVAELGLGEAGFKEKYTDSPVLRARWSGYLRNVIYALGNNPHPDAIAPLQALAASSPNQVIREAAAWALSQFDSMA